MDFIKNFKKSLENKEIKKLLGNIFKENIIQSLKEENETLRERIHNLETRVEDLEQYSRRTCLKVSGVPEDKEEDTDKIILNIANDIGVNLKPEEINRSHRLPNSKNRSPRDIVVRLTTYNKRLALIKARKQLRKPNMKQSVFINEHLTKQRGDLAYNARQLKRKGTIHDTWTRDGKIFVKGTIKGQLQIRGITRQEELDMYVKEMQRNVIQSPRFTLQEAMETLTEGDNT